MEWKSVPAGFEELKQNVSNTGKPWSSGVINHELLY
jgi:hypothetical protein